MSRILIGLIPSLLIATWFAWLQSALIYGAFRWIEKRWESFAYAGFVPLMIYLQVSLSSWNRISAPLRSPELGWTVSFVVAALFGGWFHRRSGGASRHSQMAFLLLFEAICFSIAVNDYGRLYQKFLSKYLEWHASIPGARPSGDLDMAEPARAPRFR
jgi:hypothetical protein